MSMFEKLCMSSCPFYLVCVCCESDGMYHMIHVNCFNQISLCGIFFLLSYVQPCIRTLL